MSVSSVQNAVLITGGGQRIGAYLVRQFLKETEFPVIFSYRTLHPEVKALQELGAIAIQCDFTEPGALVRLVNEIKQKTRSLRTIIHNASLWLNDTQAPAFSVEYQSLFTVHVEAPHFLNTQLEPLLQLSSSSLKDIISFSDYSVSQAMETHIAYLSSKAALQNMSRGFAKKFAPCIKVNDIAPALIQFNVGDSEEYKKKRLAQAAIGIEPGPEVVWQAIQYLMKSPYSTGTVLQLDGGRHLM